MRSRLGWGLVADIHPTTYELRLGILQAKAEHSKLQVPAKVLEFLAHKITSNVRELEGALNRIYAHTQLVGRPIAMETAQEVLHDLLRANDRRVTIDEIQKRVAEHYNIRLADMHSARRARAVARPRQVAMYLCKQLTPRSLPEIGRKFGGRDHTTVMHAVRKIEELRADDRTHRRRYRAPAPHARDLTRSDLEVQARREDGDRAAVLIEGRIGGELIIEGQGSRLGDSDAVIGFDDALRGIIEAPVAGKNAEPAGREVIARWFRERVDRRRQPDGVGRAAPARALEAKARRQAAVDIGEGPALGPAVIPTQPGKEAEFVGYGLLKIEDGSSFPAITANRVAISTGVPAAHGQGKRPDRNWPCGARLSENQGA